MQAKITAASQYGLKDIIKLHSKTMKVTPVVKRVTLKKTRQRPFIYYQLAPVQALATGVTSYPVPMDTKCVTGGQK